MYLCGKMNFFMRIIFFLLLFLVNHLAFSQEVGDSSEYSYPQPYRYEPIDTSYMREIEQMMIELEAQKQARNLLHTYEDQSVIDEMKYNFDGHSQLARGIILSFTEKDFSKRAGVFKKTNYDWGDYGVAVLPLATAWVMKASGVQSRSSWERMLLSNSMSLALTSGIALTFKELYDENGPDGTRSDAFPSGHSALAFMSATILSREYGHISPWISVGGYAAATATQFLRLRHNRHWVNQVMVGAGIGVVATNVSYFLTDKILNGRGISPVKMNMYDIKRSINFYGRPSAFSLYSGMESGNGNISSSCFEFPEDFSGRAKISTGSSFTVGVDASMYFNSYFAIEAMARLSTVMAKVGFSDDASLDASDVYGTSIDMYHFDLAAKISSPVMFGTRFSARLYVGDRFTPSGSFCSVEDGSSLIRFKGDNCFELGCGVSMDCMTSKKYNIGFYCDYNHAFSDFFRSRWLMGSTWKILF